MGNGMRAVPSPSASNLPTFFRWCLGGMSPFASGSGPASVRGADAGVGAVQHLFNGLAAECDPMPASQDDLIVGAPFVGSGEREEEVEVAEGAEVFSTPPLTQQDQAGDGEEDGITMCTMPFTQQSPASPPVSSSSPSSESPERFRLKPRKPRICTRKVRGGANKIRTPTPSPNPSPGPASAPAPAPAPGPELDPLAKIVLMIPSDPLPTSGYGDILELARSRGIFSVAYATVTEAPK